MTASEQAEATAWLLALGGDGALVDGLVRVADYQPDARPPEEVLLMEKAKMYGAYAVFFQGGGSAKASNPQAFVFLSDNGEDDAEFALVHKRLWSWGGVPLAYRRTRGLIQLFRCAHKPDFISEAGDLVCRPVKTLKIAAAVNAAEAWWDAGRLRNGTVPFWA